GPRPQGIARDGARLGRRYQSLGLAAQSAQHRDRAAHRRGGRHSHFVAAPPSPNGLAERRGRSDMNRQRFIALMVAALLAISGALYLSTQRNLPRDPHGMALLPTLSSELNSVSALTVRKGAAAPVTIHKQGEQWTVAERADYPADVP